MADGNMDLFPEAELDTPRSVLYHLPLEGCGTSHQESLLSYFHRLARAHNVHVVDLLQKVVVPRTDIRGAWFTSRFSSAYIKTANGYVKYAQQLVDALEALTLRSELRHGTFLPWLPLVDPHGGALLHPRPRWCPSCIAEQLESSGTVRFPLIWSCAAVEHCAVHLSALHARCPWCEAPQLFLSDLVSMGRCTSCKAVLGRRDGLWDKRPTARQRFLLDGAAAMVEASTGAERHAHPVFFSRALSGLMEAYFGGSINKFEKALGVSKQTAEAWIKGSARPRFGTFLEICYRLDVPPLRLLSADFEPSMHGGQIRRSDTVVAGRPKQVSAEQRVGLKADVERIVGEGRYATAKEVAAKNGLSALRFKYAERETFDRLVEHSSSVRHARSEAKLAAKCDRAREVVRGLFSVTTHLTRGGVGKAIQAAGLCMLHPEVRRAALDELRRLRELSLSASASDHLTS